MWLASAYFELIIPPNILSNTSPPHLDALYFGEQKRRTHIFITYPSVACVDDVCNYNMKPIVYASSCVGTRQHMQEENRYRRERWPIAFAMPSSDANNSIYLICADKTVWYTYMWIQWICEYGFATWQILFVLFLLLDRVGAHIWSSAISIVICGLFGVLRNHDRRRVICRR